MGLIITGGTSGVDQDVNANKAARVTVYPNGAENYRIAMLSNAYTGYAAGTATAGHIYAFRWGSATHAAVIQQVFVKRRVIVGPTAAQEWGTAVYRLTGYTASHTGGTEATKTGDNTKKHTTSAGTRLTSSMMVSGSALTAGTHTLDAQPLALAWSWELAVAATVQKTFHDIEIGSLDAAQGAPLILRQDQGLLVRNEILMGAALSIRTLVEVDWGEVLLADL